MSNKFARCFPINDGKMLCQHYNGNWIIFSIYWEKSRKKETPSKKEEVSIADK